PQTSLAAELREEAAPAAEDDRADDFTAERAASSLGGFQRGTLRARDADDATAAAEDAGPPHDEDGPADPAPASAASPGAPAPPSDR
ncbi:histidine kinase, partial [Streptomyces sp. G35A]